MIEQFVPQEYCLKCLGCCRFLKEDSVWSPCLLDEEIQELLDKKDIPALSISSDRRIHPVPNPRGEGFICPLFEAAENRCRIYAFRPFECQLYPFLINLREKKAVLTVDLNCPYVKEQLGTKAFKEYVETLSIFINSPAQLKTLKENPHIIQAYEEVAEIIELNI